MQMTNSLDSLNRYNGSKRVIVSIKHHALINISEAKEHSTNIGFLCEEKEAIQTSYDISEAHEAFYKAILKIYSEV